jgi:hypothetical protein
MSMYNISKYKVDVQSFNAKLIKSVKDAHQNFYGNNLIAKSEEKSKFSTD